MKFLLKQKKRSAVSPVIATLLLIAIAVAAAIIVYAFVTGLIGGLTGGSSGLIVESGTLSIPTGTAADNSPNAHRWKPGPDHQEQRQRSNRNRVSHREHHHGHMRQCLARPTLKQWTVCSADEWSNVARPSIPGHHITGLPIATGQTLELLSPITGCIAPPANAGTTYSYTVTVTFTTGSGNNIQTLSLVAQT